MAPTSVFGFGFEESLHFHPRLQLYFILFLGIEALCGGHIAGMDYQNPQGNSFSEDCCPGCNRSAKYEEKNKLISRSILNK